MDRFIGNGGSGKTLMAMVVVFAVASGMLLAGCGSKGDSASSGADTTKPSVMLTNPAKDATGVPVAAVLSASFSEAMKVSTISDVTLIVNAGSEQVAGKVGFSALSNAVTFTPDAPLKYETTYTVTIKAASVTDMSNNSLNANSSTGDYVWNFTTTRSGSVDTSFGGGGAGVVTTQFPANGPSESKAVVIQAGGKILVAGSACHVSGPNCSNWDFALARYNQDGTLDKTFGIDGVVTTDIGSGLHNLANAMAIDSAGRIVLAGYVAKNNTDYDFALVRYTRDGLLDTAFGASGIENTNFGEIDVVYALAIQPDDKIVVAGSSGGSSKANFALARYKDNGSPDTTFDGDGMVMTPVGKNVSVARALALVEKGKIVVAGYADDGTNKNYALVRYDDTGKLDAGFGAAGSLSHQARIAVCCLWLFSRTAKFSQPATLL
ncbi:MAG: Ig-like domain-containing protein [Gammaproteobacteria bacterium]